ncbi:deoxyribose-phosphate aldolase [Aquabacterium sp. OR-4]|uniref:deoxyribose-phosphate aldolase n=1 Tax=Aquabacterium sp. OR-4 TaxID=2978127 RepID=UPI0021B47954|nr:deoxyribose-phosphate aldolase [Aquabacterium sp. OR-4]MDT7833961.1 deoxyribose-phosphate aldolase [Aquabacterium sp. OR-4]
MSLPGRPQGDHRQAPPESTSVSDTLLNDARIALACLDLTSLNDGDTPAAISALAAKAASPAGRPAALCVWPRFVAQARAEAPAGVAVAAVANFPDGSADGARAVADTQAIVAAGGDEVDLVLPWRALMAGDAAGAAAVVQAVVGAVRAAGPGKRLKLIIESGELASPALIAQASDIGLAAGVDFLKTSTGKTATGATPEAARVMLQAIARHQAAHPDAPRVGFKASGGVRTVADAAVYIALVRETLGEAALNPHQLRFGASGLLGDIERVLTGAGAGNTAAPGSY